MRTGGEKQSLPIILTTRHSLHVRYYSPYLIINFIRGTIMIHFAKCGGSKGSKGKGSKGGKGGCKGK